MLGEKEELRMIQKTKALVELVFEITEKSPKKFRFTLVQRMQNLSMDILTCLYSANDTYINTKLIKDIDKSIEYVKSRLNQNSSEAYLFMRKKLYDLKMVRADKYEERLGKRLDFSYEALSKVKQLDFLIELAYKTQCITVRQNERLAEIIFEVRNLIAAYIRSDKNRF